MVVREQGEYHKMGIQLTFLTGGGSMVDIDATILIQLGVFLFMLVVLRSLLFKPVVRLIEARREATEGALEAVKTLEEEAEQLTEKVERELMAVRASFGAERDRIVEQARSKEREILRQARSEAHELVVKMRERTEALAQETRRQLTAELDVMASLVASKAMNRKI
jgi:F-type H+-transporting ATPase subunit b